MELGFDPWTPSSWMAADPAIRSLRPSLGWLLLVAIAMSVAALWWPDATPELTAHPPEGATASVQRQDAGMNKIPLARDLPRLPSSLTGYTFDVESGRNPFGQNPAPFALTGRVKTQGDAIPVVSAPVLKAQETTPPPPMLNYRYIGQMTGPDGVAYVYLARSDSAVRIQAGTVLEDGYIVERIDSDAVKLQHHASSGKVKIPIPQQFERN